MRATTILETGGGIHNALPLLGDEPFLVVNADIFTDMPVPHVDLDTDDMGHLVMVQSPDYRDGGDFDLDEDRIRNGASQSLTFSGVAVYRPNFSTAARQGVSQSCRCCVKRQTRACYRDPCMRAYGPTSARRNDLSSCSGQCLGHCRISASI